MLKDIFGWKALSELRQKRQHIDTQHIGLNCDAQHKHPVSLYSGRFTECNILCYADCYYTECSILYCYAEWYYAESRYAECRGAYTS